MSTDGRTDRRTNRHKEANSRFSQFCEGALKVLGKPPDGRLKQDVYI